jgi:RNA polymerase sigma-70 factor (ECF subfamily)
MISWKRKTLSHQSDEELLLLYKQSKRQDVFEALINRHIHKAYGLCLNLLKNSADAEDAVMEIFQGLPDKLLQYNIGNFSGWLFNVTRNHCLRVLTHRTKDRTELFEEINDDFFVENSGDDTLIDIEERRLEVLSDAIDQLKNGQKQCIILFFLQKKSYQEIEELTEYSFKEIKSHIQNGKRNLKNLILKMT